MKKYKWLVSILAILMLVSSTVFANSNSRKKDTRITTQKQLQKMIKKNGLKKPILAALRSGALSGQEISSSAFKSKKAKSTPTATILTEIGISRMAIISAGVNAGLDAQSIARGIKRGLKNRHGHPVCGNPGGTDSGGNPISKVRPWRKKHRRHHWGNCL